MSAVGRRRSFWVYAILSASFVVGCGEGTSGSDGVGGDSSTGAVASYRVPVPPELAPWATYPVDDADVKRNGEEVEISYDFPKWLNGDGGRIVLEGVQPEGVTTFDVVAKDVGTGTCVVTGTDIECTEQLPGLEIDAAKAEDRMKEAGLDAEEIAQRLDVTARFSADPIGIFDLEEP